MGVDLRRCERSVTQQLLDGTQVRAALEQVRGGACVAARAGPGRAPPATSRQPVVHQPCGRPAGRAGRRARRGTSPDRSRRSAAPAARGQPVLEGPRRRQPERDGPLLATLAEHPDHPARRGRSRRRRARPARRPGCRWRRAARAPRGRAAPPGAPSSAATAATSISAAPGPGRRTPGRCRCGRADPSSRPGSAASTPRRWHQAVNAWPRRRGAPGSSAPRRRGLRAEPAAQHGDVDAGRVVDPRRGARRAGRPRRRSRHAPCARTGRARLRRCRAKAVRAVGCGCRELARPRLAASRCRPRVYAPGPAGTASRTATVASSRRSERAGRPDCRASRQPPASTSSTSPGRRAGRARRWTSVDGQPAPAQPSSVAPARRGRDGVEDAAWPTRVEVVPGRRRLALGVTRALGSASASDVAHSSPPQRPRRRPR